MFHEMFQFRQNCCFQWKTPIQTFLKCWRVCFFFGFLATTVPPTGCCSAVYAQVLHTRMPALLVSPRKVVWWYCPAITTDQNTANDCWLQSLLNNKSVLTSLLQQRQCCRWWRLANFHHCCHSRGPLPCLCLHNRTWKIAGVFYAKNH